MLACTEAIPPPRAVDSLRRYTLATAFHDGELWQPLPGLFHRDLLPQVEQQLSSPRHALHTLLDHCNARAVPIPRAWATSIDVNRPRDLERPS